MNGEDSEEEEAGGGQAKAFSISPLVLGQVLRQLAEREWASVFQVYICMRYMHVVTCLFVYCRTYGKSCERRGGNGGHVLKDTTSHGLCG